MRRLLSVERHQKILERVASENAVDFASLADELGVSSMTVRRDLRILEEAGYLKTTRGGVTTLHGMSVVVPFAGVAGVIARRLEGACKCGEFGINRAAGIVRQCFEGMRAGQKLRPAHMADGIARIRARE